MPDIEQTAAYGWSNCYRLTNPYMTLIVTADVGPRIIHCGLRDGPNLFATFPEMLGQQGGEAWRIYGGHRLWAAPEVKPRTYYPDNAPVQVTQLADGARFTPPPESVNGIAKSIDVHLAPDRPRATVTHRIQNTGVWPIELAPWALSVMDRGGTAIIPHPPRGSHQGNLLPVNTLTCWAYTNMADPRWTWGEQYVLLRQDSTAPNPQKIGMMVTERWAAYAHPGGLFIKTFPACDPEVAYPDLGCNVETFTNSAMLELETLGPLTVLEPGESVEHEEVWHLFPPVPAPHGDADVTRDILPLVEQALD
ncbi:MAG: hypothetical protein Kow0077_08720 [Anaerolineae bacterium]